MSNLKLAPDAGTSDKTAIAGAVAVLTEAARKDAASVKALLANGGFEIVGFVAPLQPKTGNSGPDEIGQLVHGRGVHLGSWSFDPQHAPVDVYSADDFLRDKAGQQLILTFNEAVQELASRNDGSRYGNGTEAALRQALREGKYKDGDLILAPREILNGWNARGEHVRHDNNVCDSLRTAPAFKKLLSTVIGSSGADRWSVSGSESPDVPSYVWHVLLTYGVDDWYTKDTSRSGVVPARIFTGPSPQPGPAG